MSYSAASFTSRSTLSKSGGEMKRFSFWISDQNIGSLTLLTWLLCISSKSFSLSVICGEIPAKEAGATRAAAGDAGRRATKRRARRSGSLRLISGGPVVSEIIAAFGAWRSLVARTVRVGEVPGSNPGAPISFSSNKFYAVCRPRRRAWLLALALPAAALAIAPAATAHVTKASGPYRLEIGWGNEPALAGSVNFVQVETTNASGAPVAVPAGALTAEVTYGERAKTVPLVPTEEPGELRGGLIPSLPGSYAFEVTGTLQGNTVDVRATCGEATFECVESAASVEFPVTSPTTGEVAQRLDRESSGRPTRKTGPTGPGPWPSSPWRWRRSPWRRRWRWLAGGSGGPDPPALPGAPAHGAVGGLAPQAASAHAGLTASEPAPGATLGAAPAAVRLTFSEQPEASLSEIRVLGPGGPRSGAAPPDRPPRTPSPWKSPCRGWARGVYTVSWKIVSAVDGHGTDGSFAFGVRASPAGVAATEGATLLAIELGLRAARALGPSDRHRRAARRGGRRGRRLRRRLRAPTSPSPPAAGPPRRSASRLLADAQRVTAGSSLGDLLDTSVGQALLWRAAGLARRRARPCSVAWRAPRLRRAALGLAAARARSARSSPTSTPATPRRAAGRPRSRSRAQVAHFAAAGVWFGGLAALLLGVRGEPSAAKAAAVRRFSPVALVALLVVFATGTLRAVDELGSWGELLDSGYGRAVLAKLALIALIVAIAARNRRGACRPPSTDLGAAAAHARGSSWGCAGRARSSPRCSARWRRRSRASGRPAGLSASRGGLRHHDPGRADDGLRRAGPEPLRGAGRGLRLGRPDRAPTASACASRRSTTRGPALDADALAPARTATFAGSGPNLAFDGRWGVDALVDARRRARSRSRSSSTSRPRAVRLGSAASRASRRSTRCRSAATAGSGSSPTRERAGPSQIVRHLLHGLRRRCRRSTSWSSPRRRRRADPSSCRCAGSGLGRFVAEHRPRVRARWRSASSPTRADGTRLRGRLRRSSDSPLIVSSRTGRMRRITPVLDAGCLGVRAHARPKASPSARRASALALPPSSTWPSPTRSSRRPPAATPTAFRWSRHESRPRTSSRRR